MQMEAGYVTTVVITGLVIVFIGLVLLIGFVFIIGKVFSFFSKKENPGNIKPEINEPIKPITNLLPEVKIEDGISGEIVAVISAAVSAMSSDYKLTDVKKSKTKLKSSRRTAWGNKGLSESTSVF